MKRLIENESLLDGPDKRLAELFRAARAYTADSYVIDEFRKRRILVRLEAGARTARGTSGYDQARRRSF